MALKSLGGSETSLFTLGYFTPKRPLNEREVAAGNTMAWEITDHSVQSTLPTMSGVFGFGIFPFI